VFQAKLPPGLLFNLSQCVKLKGHIDVLILLRKIVGNEIDTSCF
jgi:hypothetical protein